jgi:anti-sigma B factor antagonist
LSEQGFARGRLAVSVSELGGQFLISLSGEADAATADALRASLEEILDQGASDLVLDLAELELLDSSGLGVLVGVLKRINERQGRMLLRSPRGTTRRVFEITGLDQVFSIAD